MSCSIELLCVAEVEVVSAVLVALIWVVEVLAAVLACLAR